MKKPNVERRGLLEEPEEFDIDSLDYLEPQDGQARHTSQVWSRTHQSRRRRWLRPRFICFGILTLIALLLLGVGLNKGAGIKTFTSTTTSTWMTTPVEQEEPKSATSPSSPAASESPTSPETPEVPEQLEPHVSSELHKETQATHKPELHQEPEAPKQPDPLNSPDLPKKPTPSTTPYNENSVLKHPGVFHSNASNAWEKPIDFKIIGLVFFGRPANIAILDCYLKKNLISNGGWLDEVHFVVNTDKKDDIKYLKKLVKTSDRYKKMDLAPGTTGRDGYQKVWQTVEREHMYIKIDDDVVSCIRLHYSSICSANTTIYRSSSTTMLYRTLFTQSSNTLSPSMSLPTLSIVLRLAGFIIDLELSMLIYPRWSRPKNLRLIGNLSVRKHGEHLLYLNGREKRCPFQSMESTTARRMPGSHFQQTILAPHPSKDTDGFRFPMAQRISGEHLWPRADMSRMVQIGVVGRLVHKLITLFLIISKEISCLCIITGVARIRSTKGSGTWHMKG